ncbi:hypothetical protein [Arcanobacterium phocae]|uniref:hypothetical protein n=3 Tax=Arcanobacterium phocae TaxID=131112 RepID=UPI001C118686|nr:hypothetical protein [Arcanobacterium phocae]
MRRLVRGVGVFLGVVIVCLAFLRAVQLENMLPMDSDDVGYINFRHSPLSISQIDEGLAQIGQKTGVELLQLSGTVGTREVTITSRAANQPSTAQKVNFFRPNKTGTLYPASEQPSQSRSGIYAVKGDATQIASLKTWLNNVDAIHTWENFTVFQTYFLPLAYQGIILVLAVTVFLVVATIFGWFTTRADSRIVRLSAGQTKTHIVNGDSTTLVSLVLIPMGATILVSFALTVIIIGRSAFQMILPLTVLFISALIATTIAITAISYVTFPRLRDWVERRSLVATFSWVGATMSAISIVLALASLPIVYRAYLVSGENQEAARQASHLPEYYSASFGGIVDEQRDYDPFIIPFAQLTSELEAKNHVSLFRRQYVSPEDVGKLSASSYESIVIVTPSSLDELEKIPAGCHFSEIADTAQARQARDLATDVTLIERQAKPQLRFFTCQNNGSTIAVANQGIFSLAPNPLVILVPNLKTAFPAETIMSLATLGSVVFHDPQELISRASSLGLNLTSDSTADSITVYAQDQQLGYYVSLISIGALLFTAAFSMFVSAQLYAAARLRSFFPRYIGGTSVRQLVHFRILLDMAFIGLGIGIALIIAFAMSLNMPILFLAACGAILLAIDIVLRYQITRIALASVCQRKN